MRLGVRCTGAPSRSVISTPARVMTATSSSSSTTTSRVWERMAGMSEARKVSSSPSPTTTLPAPSLAATSRSGMRRCSTTMA
jgi:hypothetical protein